MYTNRNFELLDYETNETPPVHTPVNVADADLFGAIFSAVVISLVVGLVLLFLGRSLIQGSPSTQPLTERKQNEYLQAERRSPARSGGGERSSSPPAERSTPTQSTPTPIRRGAKEEAPKAEVVVAEQGATAPSFHWFCFRGSMLCEVQDSMGNTIQEFWLENWSIRSSAIHSSYGRLPPAWGCGVKVPKLDCSFQDGRGHITQRFLYDGQNMQNIEVIENAE